MYEYFATRACVRHCDLYRDFPKNAVAAGICKHYIYTYIYVFNICMSYIQEEMHIRERERVRKSKRERVNTPALWLDLLAYERSSPIAVAEETRRRDRQIGQIDTHRELVKKRALLANLVFYREPVRARARVLPPVTSRVCAEHPRVYMCACYLTFNSDARVSSCMYVSCVCVNRDMMYACTLK